MIHKTRKELNSAPDGVYLVVDDTHRVPVRSMQTHYNIEDDMDDPAPHQSVLLARVRPKGVLPPKGIFEAFVREDGKTIVFQWVLEA